jgi:hypothetical protein
MQRRRDLAVAGTTTNRPASTGKITNGSNRE